MAKAQKKPTITNAQQLASSDADAKPAQAKKDPSNKATKAELVIKLLRRKNGTTLADLQTATGWQAHSVHGFLSGTVRKRMGLPLKSEVTDKGERRYLITGS